MTVGFRVPNPMTRLGPRPRNPGMYKMSTTDWASLTALVISVITALFQAIGSYRKSSAEAKAMQQTAATAAEKSEAEDDRIDQAAVNQQLKDFIERREKLHGEDVARFTKEIQQVREESAREIDEIRVELKKSRRAEQRCQDRVARLTKMAASYGWKVSEIEAVDQAETDEHPALPPHQSQSPPGAGS